MENEKRASKNARLMTARLDALDEKVERLLEALTLIEVALVNHNKHHNTTQQSQQ